MMIPILSRAQIRSYDEHAIVRCAVPSLVLMENAGRAAAELIAERCPGPVVIACGRGNNGGDGFVVARHLLARGLKVRTMVIGAREQVGGDARANLEALLGLGGDVTFLDADLAPLRDALAAAGVVVDALFGTGLTRPVIGAFREAIEIFNASDPPKVALDIPSGIDADSGAILGAAVRADRTVTFAHRKSGLLQGPGAVHAGAIHVVSLGIPDAALLQAVGHSGRVIAAHEVARALGRRPPGAHKYQAGGVLIAAGQSGKVGAALLAARGALRAGAGLVTLASWSDAVDHLEGRLPEAMTLRLGADAPSVLESALARAKAAGVGPGFGLGEPARRAIEAIALGWEGPLVIDADAISAFAGRAGVLAGARGPRILTPHAGELGRLIGVDSAAIEAARFASARRAAETTGAVIVLKGFRTVVASADALAVCDRGDAVMATAGAGDVLTGVVTALAAIAAPFEAACAAVYLHARAGELWREAKGADRGLLAGELAELVPAAMAEVQAPSRRNPARL